jgi:hypothetical protein
MREFDRKETKLVEGVLAEAKAGGWGECLTAHRIVKALQVQHERDAPQVQADTAEFWAEVFRDWQPNPGEDPKTKREQIEAELTDYRFVMHEVSLVYDYITNGRMTKPNYFASVVISEYENVRSEEIEQALKDAKEDAP